MFTWDPAKSEENRRRRHIAFEDAVSAFEGPILTQYDGREDYGEDRWVMTGLMGVVVIVLVYTERGDVVRVISARRAKTYERERFEAHLRSL